MTVHVRFADGAVCTYAIAPSTTICEVAQWVRRDKQIPHEHLRLVDAAGNECPADSIADGGAMLRGVLVGPLDGLFVARVAARFGVEAALARIEETSDLVVLEQAFFLLFAKKERGGDRKVLDALAAKIGPALFTGVAAAAVRGLGNTFFWLCSGGKHLSIFAALAGERSLTEKISSFIWLCDANPALVKSTFEGCAATKHFLEAAVNNDCVDAAIAIVAFARACAFSQTDWSALLEIAATKCVLKKSAKKADAWRTLIGRLAAVGGTLSQTAALAACKAAVEKRRADMLPAIRAAALPATPARLFDAAIFFNAVRVGDADCEREALARLVEGAAPAPSKLPAPTPAPRAIPL